MQVVQHTKLHEFSVYNWHENNNNNNHNHNMIGCETYAATDSRPFGKVFTTIHWCFSSKVKTL